jgi:hypothetical protein
MIKSSRFFLDKKAGQKIKAHIGKTKNRIAGLKKNKSQL